MGIGQDWTINSACVLAWLFTEGSGTTVADASGNSNSGTFQSSGHPVWATDNPPYNNVGNAKGDVSYGSANSDSITGGTSSGVLDNTGAGSFVALVNFNAITGTYGSNTQQIFQKRKVGTAQINCFPFGTNQIGFYRDTNTFDFVMQSATNSITTGAWHHLAITWPNTGTVANHHIYVDAVEVSYTGNHDGTGGLIANSTGTVYIGNATGTSQSLNGKMTDVGIFNTQLSSGNITDIYNYGIKPFMRMRRTLSNIGTGVGKRQMQGWN